MKQTDKQQPAGQWAKQQQKSSDVQAHQGNPQAGERLEEDEKVPSEGAPGENRKPSDTIGEVAHADTAKDAKQNKT